MGKVFDSITDDLRIFIEKQVMFFVATAPLSAEGHVNLSPKGLDCFRILSPLQVAYLDVTGSGNETAAHVTENRRITFLFCAFAGPPMIVRLHGTGRVVQPNMPEWETLRGHFTQHPGTRQIFVADLNRVSTSCGFAVPRMDFVEQRDTLIRWAEKKGKDDLAQYRAEKNAHSIDGLFAPLCAGEDDA
jgi:hypothetical protein